MNQINHSGQFEIFDFPSLPNEIDLTQGIVVFKTQNLIQLNSKIQTFVNNLPQATDFESFYQLQFQLKKYITEILMEFFPEKNENFRLSLLSNDLKYFIGSEEEKNILEKIILEKNQLYYLAFKYLGESDKIDQIFTPEQKETILQLIDSNIFGYFNFVQILGKKYSQYPENQNCTLSEGETPKYGFFKDGKIVGYNSILPISGIVKKSHLQQIPQKQIREYFLKMYELVSQNVVDEAKWLEIEKISLGIWLSPDVLFGLGVPIESYQFKDILRDIEFELFLKNLSDTNKFTAKEISVEYFGEDFGIQSTQTFQVEPILSSGRTSFMSILGKSFPNHPDLTQEFGTLNFAIPSRLGELFLQKTQPLFKKFGIPNIEAKFFEEQSVLLVDFHEFGHSLFQKNNNLSHFEEAKADLFYYLYLDWRYKNAEMIPEEVKNFVGFSVIQAIRVLRNKSIPEAYQYVLGAKIVLQGLINNGLVDFDENLQVDISSNEEKFKDFLTEMRIFLTDIKILYGTPEKDFQELQGYMQTKLNAKIETLAEQIFQKIQN